MPLVYCGVCVTVCVVVVDAGGIVGAGAGGGAVVVVVVCCVVVAGVSSPQPASKAVPLNNAAQSARRRSFSGVCIWRSVSAL